VNGEINELSGCQSAYFNMVMYVICIRTTYVRSTFVRTLYIRTCVVRTYVRMYARVHTDVQVLAEQSRHELLTMREVGTER